MYHQRISFAGAGKVASALCKEFYKAGHTIDLIVSESEKSSSSLAEKCNASWSAELVYPDTTDIIIVAVPDQRIKSVLNTLKCSPDTIVVHTGGSTGLDIFPGHIKRTGIFYPLQTFTRERDVVFKKLPFLLESADENILQNLKSLAESLGGEVHYVDSEHRRMIHLAAVFICNFTNYMLTQGEEVAVKAGYSLDLFKPLLAETIAKAMEVGPKNSQTGPASRNDISTIEKHLELLSFSPELQRLYGEVTDSIIGYYKDKRQK
ncbi:MAG: DUF2520 domain-containing protein [Bacteroidales bacterium]|nr:DUF2520 domain-containing protein [Bacteroidales bacterium]MBK7626207.1 DUF2520 domain-containing protein [Bacteroidales bacterium]